MKRTGKQKQASRIVLKSMPYVNFILRLLYHNRSKARTPSFKDVPGKQEGYVEQILVDVRNEYPSTRNQISNDQCATLILMPTFGCVEAYGNG